MAERDYAKEFKDSFSISEIGKALEVLNEWNDYDDTNCGLALVILSSLSNGVEFDHILEIYMNALNGKPANPDLYDWFNTTALDLMEKRLDDDIGLREMFNNVYRSDNPSNDYAKEFLALFSDILENEDIDKLNELKDLVNKWENDYPSDANMHCAYVILNFKDLSKDELQDRVKKAKEYSPIDKNEYARLLTYMNAILNKIN